MSLHIVAMEYFVSNLNKISIIFGMVVFIIFGLKNMISENKLGLDKIISSVTASFTVPTAFALFFCSLEPSLIPKMNGVEVNLFIAGCALFYVSTVTIIKDWHH